ncbi:DNA glycosylase AlkZ-like family protein [Ktedonobacter robiniae]|uniref:Uncharacterized protein n=1 Tax=Ktedonobacter robiniae TaxID=2778365 RepID=A0ABQ3V2I3_9CHLR|nr:crosslink repair DNA glycosylase YcaQ family protein [Ktedonobacter robiniae]GHO58982.1 hypothetical protein KSB_74570 [Ktedonobacter robiniae]
MGAWPSIEPEQALQELVRRYLRAYGPAAVEDFARWCWNGEGRSQAKQLFQSMKDEFEEVDVEG